MLKWSSTLHNPLHAPLALALNVRILYPILYYLDFTIICKTIMFGFYLRYSWLEWLGPTSKSVCWDRAVKSGGKKSITLSSEDPRYEM